LPFKCNLQRYTAEEKEAAEKKKKDLPPGRRDKWMKK
jgi:hypothetical protein